jgi:hypothetical protein
MKSTFAKTATVPANVRDAAMYKGLARFILLWVSLGFAAVTPAEHSPYHRVEKGVAIYLGVVPAAVVRGHPPEHTESQMHGGVPLGESHIVVALFENKTGKRLTGAVIDARVTGTGTDVQKTLEPMEIAGTVSYGNYFYMSGSGPYRILLRIRLPGGGAHELRTTFTWTRS